MSIYWLGSDNRNIIWMHTDLGLLRVVPSSRTVVSVMEASQLEPDLTNFEFDLDRRVLYVTVDATTVVAIGLDFPQKVPLPVLSIPDRQRITAMAYDKHGLWLVAGTSLWRWDAKDASLKRVMAQVPMLRATEMVVDRQGVLWLASDIDSSGGLYRVDPVREEVSIYRHNSADPQSLRHNRIWSLALDVNNDLWIGTRGGVNRLRLKENGVKRIALPGGIPAAICAIHRAGPKLLVSVCDGTLHEFDPASGRWDPVPSDLGNILSKTQPGIANTISGLMDDGEGGLWIAGGMGLVHWRRKAPPISVPLAARPTAFITATLLDSKRKLWAITHSNGLAALYPGETELRSVDQIGSKGILTSIAAGLNDSLWLGSEHGLIHYQPESGRVSRFTYAPNDPSSISDDHVLHIYVDAADTLWVGTRAGLNRVVVNRKGHISFRRYGTKDGLPDQTVEVILNDATGDLWVGTDRGIARWQPQLDRFQGYTSADGIPDDTIRKGGAVLGQDGGLYFGTSKSLWRLDPSKLRLADPAHIAVSSYEVGNTTFVNHLGHQLKRIDSKYQDGRVVFRLASFGEPRRLSYRLSGLEEQWRDMPADLSVAYHRIQPGSYELQIRQLDGHARWVPGLALKVDVEPPIWRSWWAYMAYAVVVSLWASWLGRSYLTRRRRRYEYFRALRDRDERLRLAMSASGGVIVEIDFHKSQISPSDELIIPRRSQKGERVGARDYLSSVHPDDVLAVERALTALQQEHSPDLEIEHRRRDVNDSWTWVRLRGRFIERTNGESAQEVFTGMVHDISQERSDRDLRQRAELLAVMSHEMRTPLNGIVGMIDLLDQSPLQMEQKNMLDACKESTSILLSIINDFLDLSKIDAGMLELEQADLSTRDLIEAATRPFTLQALNKKLHLDIYIDPEVPSKIMGDWIRLRQILTNLIGNAIKFTACGNIEIAMSTNGSGMLRLVVADTGIGIDPSVLEHLFQPFRQASASTARRFGGTGLGLSIVKSLAEAMGGEVECESRLGLGTRFILAIPLLPASSLDIELKPLLGIRVLVIAGNHNARKFIRGPLNWLGAEVAFTSSPESAITRILNQELEAIDVVMIDKREPAAACIDFLVQEMGGAAIPIVAIGHPTDLALGTGAIWVEGDPLVRSSLTHGIELAMGRSKPPPSAATKEPEEVALHARTGFLHDQPILLAEDNPINREVAVRQLARLGYKCECAAHGEEAWNMLRLYPGRYKLLITDGQMPILDGYQLAERVRKHEADSGDPRLKILMITAGTLTADRERCMSLDLDGFLTKPLLFEALKGKLSELLDSPVEPKADRAGAAAQRSLAEFSPLSDLAHENIAAFKRILEIFVRTTHHDLRDLDQAMQEGNRSKVMELAHRIKSACYQLGQDSAGHAVDKVERAAANHSQDALLSQLLENAKRELTRALSLTEGCLRDGEDRE
ncbi:ATP-binding protein [Lysobacter antibioticus]|uniref:ATP-binding protein n=1 Tax=Lysobacter antibioticus TaxID=84531 RepID=UPI00165134BE|nr:ATP-binding protein [Lysobacter antibioticus]